MDPNYTAVQWFLESKDPSVRYFTLTDVLEEPKDSHRVMAEKKRVPKGSRVQALLTGQEMDGGFGVHPYQKWTGAHWRLVSLVELGIPPGHRAALKAADQVLRWLTVGLKDRPKDYRGVRKVNGLWRAHASMEGNALGVCSRQGLRDDPRVRQLARSLIEWQWPDGGWNCDERAEARHSSFYESLSTLWGLIEYQRSQAREQRQEPSRKPANSSLDTASSARRSPAMLSTQNGSNSTTLYTGTTTSFKLLES